MSITVIKAPASLIRKAGAAARGPAIAVIAVIVLTCLLAGLPAAARDTVANEFNTLAAQIQNPPAAAWMQHAYSAESMPLAGERDPVDVLLRRTRTLLDEFNQSGRLDPLDQQLAALEFQNDNVPVGDSSARLALFRQIDEVSRQVAFSNPLLGFKDIVFLKRPNASYNHMCDQYFGFHQNPGGGIYVLEDAFSDNPTVRDVLAASLCENGRFQGLPLDFGSFSNPSLSFDGKTVFFAHTETGGSTYTWTENTCFHLFRVNIDGSDLRQLTDGPVNDIHPYPLPNGRIVFMSDRRGGYGRCHARKCPTYSIYSCNADGTDITLLSAHETNEWHPSVDNDGMIIYTRWDYVDRGDDQAHHPWICYPDGRDPRAIHGNWKLYRSDSPYMEQHVRAIPASHKYVATASPHHGQTFGSFVLIDPRATDDNKMSPLRILTPEAQFPESTTGSTSDWKFASAWALSERFYLCGYDPTTSNGSSNHALTLLDAKTGLKTSIYHDPAIACYHATPLIARTPPPLIPHRVASGRPLAPGETFDPSVYDSMPTTGKVVLMNVYDSTLPFPEGAAIESLRIMEVLTKTTPDHHTPHFGYAIEDPGRRVLGTVPVEPDGSAYFTVPADTPIFFQALDESGMAVQSMRSLTYVKPGETLTCAGCHEQQGSGPLMDTHPTALERAPSDITPELEGSNPFSYPRLVQPVLDDNCVTCHQQEGALDLSAGDFANNSNYWYNSYLNLEDFAFYYGDSWSLGTYDTWNATATSTPGEVGAIGSRLYQEVLAGDHHGLDLDTADMRALTLWLDSNSAFFGACENTLEQSQGQVIQPLDTRTYGYQTVVNTVYGPAIPAEPPPNFGNNDGNSEFGSPLDLVAPPSGGSANRPVTVGQQAQGGLAAPVVEAGPDFLTHVGAPVSTLGGSATVGGEPVVPGTVIITWSQLTGPATASLGDPSALSTSADFPQPGTYLLRLTVDTGVSSGSDDLLVTVLPANQSPLVDAGPDQAGSIGASLPLPGFVFDDGGQATATWTQQSGPVTALIDDPAAAITAATFPDVGTYVLRLTADDGELSTFDECTILIATTAVGDPPSVSAGEDIIGVFSTGPLSLQGSASDDGVPGPLVTSWSVVSGPGTVDFGTPNATTSTAVFSSYGYYVLQLTATDGSHTVYDQIGIYLSPSADITHFGTVTWEYWGGIGGNEIATLTGLADYPDNPHASDELTQFQSGDHGNDYGTRTHGYLLPPATGEYTFWIASDDDGELWLSTTNDPADAQLIASVDGWTNPLSWLAANQSTPITLTAGQAYYISALQKQGNGGNHMAVAWQGPGIDQAVIDGHYLAPIQPEPAPLGSVTLEYWSGIDGNAVSNLTASPDYPDNPSGAETLSTFERNSHYGEPDWIANFGSQVEALVHPPTTGEYTFWIASDDDSQLWLSSTSGPNQATMVASVTGWTSAQQWDKFPSQQSATVTLEAGQSYYINSLQKNGNGQDYLGVAWEGPGITQQVIDGQYLSDYNDSGIILPPTDGGVVLSPNQGPEVSAGPDLTITFEEDVAALRGRAVDDGMPLDPGAMAFTWIKLGGPGEVVFSAPTSEVSTASFTAPGTYLLRLEASDGELSSSDTVLVSVTTPTEHDYLYPSPQDLAWSPDGSMIAVSDVGLNRVLLVDAASYSILHTIPVEGSPRGIEWTNSAEFWICEYDAGTIARIDAASGRITRRIETGPKPCDLKLDSSRQQLVVSEYGRASVRIIDLATEATVAEVAVIAKPMHLALTPDNARALVANSEPAGDARDGAHSAALSVIDLASHAQSTITLPPGSTSLRGIRISPDGNWAYVAHLLGRTHLPTTQLNDGWVFTNVVSIIDLTSDTLYASIPLDAVEEGAANPWGIALTENGDRLWVAGAGVHELIRIDLAAVHAHLATGAAVRANMDYDLITLYEQGWLERYRLPSNGPRGLAASPDGSSLATAAYFGGDVHLFNAAQLQVEASIATGPTAPEHALRRGERLYFDGDGCFQRWLSCSSCHPGARADGLNWDLLNDGIGNAKNTLTHLHSTATPPSMSTGVRASVAVAIEAGFKFIQFQQRSAQEMQDVYDYLNSIGPEPSPHLNKNWLTPEALSGRAIFEDPAVGCASCHNGPYFTNLQQYDVGTGHPADTGPHDPVYDTPALHELWRSAPYLHDGSAATLRDVLTTQNPADQHGNTSHLTSTELDQLVAWLQQLDGNGDWINQAPLVDAGSDQILTLPEATTALAASASDEGLPQGQLTLNWTQTSGPIAVAFGDPNSPESTATFTAAGEYVLECAATDGSLGSLDTVAITVLAEPNPDDSDLDGMGDAWENHYFGGLSAPRGGADEDWDGDGLTNLYEYLTGTDPTDRNSTLDFRITDTAGQIRVHFTAHAAGDTLTPGTRHFTLQSCVPTGPTFNWQDVAGYTGIVGADQLVELLENPNEKVKLYRVFVRLEP